VAGGGGGGRGGSAVGRGRVCGVPSGGLFGLWWVRDLLLGGVVWLMGILFPGRVGGGVWGDGAVGGVWGVVLWGAVSEGVVDLRDEQLLQKKREKLKTERRGGGGAGECGVGGGGGGGSGKGKKKQVPQNKFSCTGWVGGGVQGLERGGWSGGVGGGCGVPCGDRWKEF